MAKNDTLSRLGKEVCNEYLGFHPTSNSVKPPHIANGLFRACSGEVCDIEDVHKWIISEKRKESISSEEIIEQYHDIFEEGLNEKAENVKEIRYLMEEIFNQDNTVYPSYKNSVYNISSHWLIKRYVMSEAKIGDFIFNILSKKISGKRSKAIDIIKNALKEDNDDITRLIKPIIAFPSNEVKRRISKIEFPCDEDISWDSCKEAIRRGFDNISNNIEITGENKNSLRVLERFVNYAGFAAFLYLSKANEACYKGEKVPILIDAGTELESIKKASEQTYIAAKKAVEDYYINSLELILKSEIIGNKKKCKEWIDEMTFSSIEREEVIKPAIKNYFESFCDDGEKPIQALSHALQIALYTFEYKNNSPSDFCRVLGVRNGLVGPRGNRANVKRYLMSSFTLETIMLSILSSDDLQNGIELKSFGEKAIDMYGILFGTDVEREYTILSEANITQNTPGDLRGDMSINANALADVFIDLDLARRYADGVTLVGWRL